MARIHTPDLRLAHQFTEAFARALHGHPTEEAPAPREVPAADDWQDWSWEKNGGSH